MPVPIIDTHIHLDGYADQQINQMLADPYLLGVVTVSMNKDSAKRNLQLKQRFPKKIKMAAGFHPEQEIIDPVPLIDWIRQNEDQIDAIGEVGLPYYRRTEQKGHFHEEPYLTILEEMIKLAKELNKPIVLHAVYEDTKKVMKLLEKHSIEKAHFHWLKTDNQTLHWIANNSYFVSVTPDILYKEKTAKIAKDFPFQQLMIETDGPWPYEGRFLGRETSPQMLQEVIPFIAGLRGMNVDELADELINNSHNFYVKKPPFEKDFINKK